jgi:hypothetical protein
LLVALSVRFGAGRVLCVYGLPYVVVNAWLVIYGANSSCLRTPSNDCLKKVS